MWRTWSEQLKNGGFEMECRCFQMFFIDFLFFPEPYLDTSDKVYLDLQDCYYSIFRSSQTRCDTSDHIYLDLQNYC